MSISRWLIPPALIVLLLVSAYSVVELANRISAMRFVTDELTLARGNVTTLVNNEGSTIDETSIRPIKKEEYELKGTLQQLETLAFSGASDTGTTVYWLMRELFEQRQASTNEAISNSIRASILALNEEQTILQNGSQALQSFIDSKIPSNNAELETLVRGASNQIPRFETFNSPTASILGGIDSQFVSTISDLDSTAETGVPSEVASRFESLRQSASIARNQLTARDSALSELLLTSQQQITASNSKFAAETPQKPGWASYLGPLFFLSTLPSDFVLIFAVVSAAGVGSLFAGLHRPGDDLFSRIIKGFIAGFAALLVIKGGTVLFTIDAELSVENSNPFSAVFLGVVAGLFADKAFDALERLVNERLEGDPAQPTRQTRLPTARSAPPKVPDDVKPNGGSPQKKVEDVKKDGA